MIIVDKSHMCVSTMLVHVRGHLHLETPPIEPYTVTTLPFKYHVIQTLTPTQKLLCALAKQISTISENKLPVEHIVCQVFQWRKISHCTETNICHSCLLNGLTPIMQLVCLKPKNYQFSFFYNKRKHRTYVDCLMHTVTPLNAFYV